MTAVHWTQVCNGVVAAGAGRTTSWDDVAGQQVWRGIAYRASEQPSATKNIMPLGLCYWHMPAAPGLRAVGRRSMPFNCVQEVVYYIHTACRKLM